MPNCNECGSNVDLAKDSNMGHCATCNNVVEVKPEEKPSEPKKDDNKPKEEVKK
ncbi:hypothetical protein B0A54_04735 [Friedmanniomyces endolithicus]|uniref:Uncharacterized protein n=1 Tax=Friedmanniomyces endolithicus TaxID=329885 RepID=A0A4U0V7N1_9PEZI|nr:hypothetical protein B0A54_04735 [Friedmanniomyces endolithicus]